MAETSDPTDRKEEEETGKEIRINKESLPNCDGCCGECNWPHND